MIRSRIRRAAAAAVLACTLALAAPAHAAGWEPLAAGPRWLKKTLEWVAWLWTAEPAGPIPSLRKGGSGSNPDGSPNVTVPPATTCADSGSGSNPDGSPK